MPRFVYGPRGTALNVSPTSPPSPGMFAILIGTGVKNRAQYTAVRVLSDVFGTKIATVKRRKNAIGSIPIERPGIVAFCRSTIRVYVAAFFQILYSITRARRRRINITIAYNASRVSSETRAFERSSSERPLLISLNRSRTVLHTRARA